MTASAPPAALVRMIGRHSWQILNSPALPGTRWVSLVRASYGIALLCLPGRLITAVIGDPASARVRAVARVLGGRQLAQGVICGLAPVRELIEAGAAADGLHGASMLVLAGAQPRLRRALLAETVIAGAFASAAATSLHHQPGVANRVR